MVAGADDLALMRILNKPKRGIGNKTMDAIAEEARRTHVSMYEVLKRNEIFSGKNKRTIENFTAILVVFSFAVLVLTFVAVLDLTDEESDLMVFSSKLSALID